MYCLAVNKTYSRITISSRLYNVFIFVAIAIKQSRVYSSYKRVVGCWAMCEPVMITLSVADTTPPASPSLLPHPHPPNGIVIATVDHQIMLTVYFHHHCGGWHDDVYGARCDDDSTMMIANLGRARTSGGNGGGLILR